MDDTNQQHWAKHITWLMLYVWIGVIYQSSSSVQSCSGNDDRSFLSIIDCPYDPRSFMEADGSQRLLLDEIRNP